MADKIYEYTTDAGINYGVSLSDETATLSGLNPGQDGYATIAALIIADPTVVGMLPATTIYRQFVYTSSISGKSVYVPYMTKAAFDAAMPVEAKPFPPDHTHTTTRTDTLTLKEFRGEKRA